MQEWTAEGLTMVSRNVDANRLTYTIAQPGEFAVFAQLEEEVPDIDLRVYIPLVISN